MDWTEQQERSNPFILRLILWIAIHLRRGFTRALLHPITLYYVITSPKVCRFSKIFLSTAMHRKAGLLHVYKHIHTFASTILDRVFFLTGRHDLFDITITNRHIIKELMDAKQSAILLGSHLGSFEVLRTLGLIQRDLKLKVLMHFSHNQMISSILDTLNPNIADTVIDLDKENALINAGEFIQQGYSIGMLGDRAKADSRNIKLQFMGLDAKFPQGPALLAAIYQVPIVVFFGVYLGGNRFKIVFEKLSDIPPADKSQRIEFVESCTRKYAERLEYYATNYPYNWFNFYDFWKN